MLLPGSPLLGMDVEGGNSNAIFVFLCAVILFAFVSWTERREPNVRKVVAFVAVLFILTDWSCRQLKHIPTFGQSGYVLSYFNAFIFSISGLSKLRRGCDKVLQVLSEAVRTILMILSVSTQCI